MTDIVLDDSGDLLITAGDFTVDDCTGQEIQDIIMSYPGWWKEYPLVGCAAPNYLNSPGTGQDLSNSIAQQLKLDGKAINSYSSTTNPDGSITINVNGQDVVVES